MTTFKRDTLVYGFAVLADRVVGLLLLPILTGALSKPDFGAWNQVQVVYGFLSTALLLGYYHTVSSMVAGRGVTGRRLVYAGIVRIVLASSTALFLLCIFLPEGISQTIFADAGYAGLVQALLWYSVTECFYELVVMAFLRAEGRIATCSLFHMAKSVARFVVVAVGVHMESPLLGIFGMLGLINALLVFVTLYGYLFREQTQAEAPGQDRTDWWAATRRALAVAATVALAWVGMSSNRFVIVHYLGLDELATYSANYAILSMTTIVPMILTFTLLHHLSVHLANRRHAEARRLLGVSMGIYLYITLPMMVLIALFYPQLLQLLARGDYAGGPLLQFSLMLYFLLFGLEQIIVFATFSHAQSNALPPRLAALAVNVVLSVVLISQLGLDYAAIALCLASALMIGLGLAMLRRRMGPGDHGGSYLQIVLAGAAMALAAWGGARIGLAAHLPAMLLSAVALLALFALVESLGRQSLTRAFWHQGLGLLHARGRAP